MNNSIKNIVVLGAGFGGLQAALKLAKKFKNRPEYRVVLVDRNSYQTYTPALYEVASAYKGGKLKNSAEESEFEGELADTVSFSFKNIFDGKDVDIVQDEVVDINTDTKTISLKSGAYLDYEYCVIALGAEAAHYNVQGADECCSSLKTIRDALNIRFATESLFRKNFQENEELRFITIGAGLSGFEVTAELAKYVEHLRQSAYNYDPSKIHISIVEAKNDILPEVSDDFRRFAGQRLEKLGINVITDARIVSIEPHQITLEDDSTIPASFILWGGGIKGPEVLKSINNLPLDRLGRIVVDKDLRVRGLEDVFAVGDSAYIYDEKKGKPVPATAWAAEQEALFVAENIYRSVNSRPLAGFLPVYPGFISAAGGKYGIVQIFGLVTLKGFAGWAVKRLIDLKYLLSIYPFWKAAQAWLKQLDIWGRND